MGRRGRGRSDLRRRRDPAPSPAVALHARDRRPGARPAHPARADRLRLRAALLAARADPRHVARACADRSARSPSRSRSRCSPSPGSRRSRTLPRRRGGPVSTFPARSSSRSAPSSPPTSRSRSSRSRPSRGPHTALGTTLAALAARRRRPADPGAHRRSGLGDTIRFFVGASGALILARVRHHVDLGLLAPRLLARRARPASARVRPAAPANPGLASGDRQRSARLERDRDRDVVHQARRRVPRERLLLRRPARVHRDADRRDQAARRRARPAAPLPRPAQHHDPRGGDPRSGDRRRGADLRRLDRRARHASRRALRRAGVARDRASSSSSPCAAPTAKASPSG